MKRPLRALRTIRACLVPLALALLAPPGHANPKPPVAGASAPAAVFTRAVVRSVAQEDGGKRLLIRLKLVPRGKLPFTTITYRVVDGRLVAGLKEGDSVAFVARRIDGENTVTAIRRVPPCERFRPCGPEVE